MSEPDVDDPREAALASARMRTIVMVVAGTGLAFTVGAFAGFGVRAGIGTFIGAFLATSNLMLFVRLGAAFVSRKGNSAPFAVIGGVKMLALFFCVYILLKRGDVPALSLLTGYGALPIGITLSSLFKSAAPPLEPEPSATSPSAPAGSPGASDDAKPEASGPPA